MIVRENDGRGNEEEYGLKKSNIVG